MFTDGRPCEGGLEWQLGSQWWGDPSRHDRKGSGSDGPRPVSLMRLLVTGDAGVRVCVGGVRECVGGDFQRV